MVSSLTGWTFVLTNASHRRKNLPRPPGTRAPSNIDLAMEVGHRSVTSRKLGSWYQAGTRLIFLAAASKCFSFVSSAH